MKHTKGKYDLFSCVKHTFPARRRKNLLTFRKARAGEQGWQDDFLKVGGGPL